MENWSNFKEIELTNFLDERGNLTVVESNLDIPFSVKRIYYIYGVPQEKRRGGHAHRKLKQLLIAIAGSFYVSVDDGNERAEFHLYRPSHGLYISNMVWRDLVRFSPNSICLVLASEYYDESDYFREYDVFLKTVKEDYELDRIS